MNKSLTYVYEILGVSLEGEGYKVSKSLRDYKRVLSTPFGKREEKISFYIVSKYTTDISAVLAPTVSLRYPGVERDSYRILSDEKCKYPLVSGSVGLYADSVGSYYTEKIDYINGGEGIKRMIEVVRESENGLFSKYSDLRRIVNAVENDYVLGEREFDISSSVDVVTICLLKELLSKGAGCEWMIKKNIPNDLKELVKKRGYCK